jgi:hypothetical protein
MVFMLPFLPLFTPHFTRHNGGICWALPANLGRCQDLLTTLCRIHRTGVGAPIVECLGRTQQMHWTELHARGV